ncbi:MAG: 4Fe-4S dicluster domain-containing protein [Candidatus Odinarchaeia archaeon]
MCEAKTVKLDLEKLRDVRKEVKEFNIDFCNQCGTCTGGCPVAKIADKFNPRKIVLKTFLGYFDELIEDQNIWLCTTCYNCSERCPQGIEVFHDIILKYRNSASKLNKLPEEYKQEALALISNGITVPLSPLIEKRRSKLGLPAPPKIAVEEVQKILKATGFKEIVK